MKFDLHCHTKEGSIDARVGIEDYVKRLMQEGFDGMLITDHNSYKGYRKWMHIRHRIESSRPFTVLKGIEYDTRDGGHFIAVLPEGISCRLLELRGLSAMQLEHLVHSLGGILGPAHPYGTGFFAFMNTRIGKKRQHLLDKFDFIETFNSCTHPFSNHRAKQLAGRYHKPHFAGSDAHEAGLIGSAYTLIGQQIRNNDDFIRAVKAGKDVRVEEDFLQSMYHSPNPLIRQLGIIGYYIYNKLGAFLYLPARIYYAIMYLLHHSIPLWHHKNNHRFLLLPEGKEAQE